jgi:hypothetical protein
VLLNTRQAQGSGQSCLGIRFLKASALFLVLLQTGWAQTSAGSLTLTPNLLYRTQSCQVPRAGLNRETLPLRFRELRLAGEVSEPQLIVRNTATVRSSSQCSTGYVGDTLPQLVQRLEAQDHQQVLGATNGNFFYLGRDARMHSTGLVLNHRQEILSPLRAQGGNYVVLRSSEGQLKTLILEKVGCEPRQPCRMAVVGVVGPEVELPLRERPSFQTVTSRRRMERGHVLQPPGALRGPLALDELTRKILLEFPDTRFAMQLSQPLGGVKSSPTSPELDHYTRCRPEKDPQEVRSWRCQPAPRTVLCLRPDHSLSVMTTPAVLPYTVALGLRPQGPCESGCTQLFNLDGGGSTQMGIRRVRSAEFELVQGRFYANRPQCPTSRPVENVLIFAVPQAATPQAEGGATTSHAE